MSTLLLARHGEKEGDGPTNWSLRLTPTGVLDIQRTAASLLAAGLRPTRIISSPFPRCVQTAALYAAALLPPSAPRLIAIEPGLCEVLTPKDGGRGLSAPPGWTAQELGAIAAAAAPGTALDGAYAPAVPASDLRLERSSEHREDVEARVRRVCGAISGGGGASGLVLYVSHGGPLRRFADALCPGGAPFREPEMGTVLHIVEGRVAAVHGPSAPAQAAAGAGAAPSEGSSGT